MIPKVIHYCWFGRNPLPEIVQKCIESWREKMPDYEIKRWDETNVPYQDFDFMREAYDAKKYAFVSDQARYLMMKQYGGFFLDTDVEVVKSFDDLRFETCFFGLEKHVKKNVLYVNPGLIMGAERCCATIEKVFELYCGLHFVINGRLQMQYTSPCVLTKYLLENEGLVIEDKCQTLSNGIRVYATDYFDPQIPRAIIHGAKFDLTENTYTIHHGAASWVPRSHKVFRLLSIFARSVFGDKFVDSFKTKIKRRDTKSFYC